MKTLKYYILPLCGAVLASCADLNVETATSSHDESSETKTVLTAVIGPGTRTVLGEKNEKGEYPVSWQATDKINVNGVASSGVELSEGSAKASFSFAEELSAPYNAVYPADVYKAAGSATPQEGEDAVSEGVDKVTVTIPKAQTYNAGTFDAGSSVMYARAESGTELVFHHLMAYLKLSFSTESDTDPIKTITLKSRGSEPMSGDFTIDFAASSPTLAYASEAAATAVTVDCGTEGVGLGTEVIVAVPAQTYASGIEITTTDTNGDKTVHLLKQSFQAVAGTVYPMPITFELYPGSRQKPIKVGNLLWAPVYCGYSKEHPNGLLYQYGRKAGQPYYPASENSSIIKAGPVSDPVDEYFYKGTQWYSGTALTSWPMSESETGYIEGKIDNPCPEGWRLPTIAEFQGLLDIGFTQSEDWAFSYSKNWTEAQQNASVVKAGFTLKDGSGLFFAAVGGRTGAGRGFYRSNEDAYARIWASNRNNSDMTKASCLNLQRKTDSVEPNGFDAKIRNDYTVAGGISVRCVKDAK